MTARRRNPRRIVTATGIGGAALLGTSLSTKAGSPQFYILTIGVTGTWAAGALSSGPIQLDMTQGWDGARCRAVVMSVLTGAGAFGTCSSRRAGRWPSASCSTRWITRGGDSPPTSADRTDG
jgi:hypothetical protein